MRRASAGVLGVSLSLFLLSLPTLHLHPTAAHEHNPLLHNHFPHSADGKSSRGVPEKGVERSERGELRSVAIDILALCPSALSSVPAPQFVSLLEADPFYAPDRDCEFFDPPDPNAQAPPGTQICHFLRGPPA